MRTLLLSSLAILMSGCVTIAATHQGMVPATFETTTKHPYSVSVVVAGIQEAIGAGELQVSEEALNQALVESVAKSQIFARTAQKNDADYVLTVFIMNIDRKIGPPFDFTVNVESGWNLKRADTGMAVWQESVRSSHTATIREALDGAVRNNIKQGLEKISGLKL